MVCLGLGIQGLVAANLIFVQQSDSNAKHCRPIDVFIYYRLACVQNLMICQTDAEISGLNTTKI